MTDPGLMVRAGSKRARPGTECRSWPCCFSGIRQQHDLQQLVSDLRRKASASHIPERAERMACGEEGYAQAPWKTESRDASERGPGTPRRDRSSWRARLSCVEYFDAITNNYYSSTAGNHRVDRLGSNSPNTPNGLSPYLSPVKDPAASCVRPCSAMLHPWLSEGRSAMNRLEFTAGRSIWRDNRQLRRSRRPRQERTPSWQPMQS